MSSFIIYSSPKLIRAMESRKMRWAGHIAWKELDEKFRERFYQKSYTER
jgi:hypothetical protein